MALTILVVVVEHVLSLEARVGRSVAGLARVVGSHFEVRKSDTG